MTFTLSCFIFFVLPQQVVGIHSKPIPDDPSQTVKIKITDQYINDLYFLRALRFQQYMLPAVQLPARSPVPFETTELHGIKISSVMLPGGYRKYLNNNWQELEFMNGINRRFGDMIDFQTYQQHAPWFQRAQRNESLCSIDNEKTTWKFHQIYKQNFVPLKIACQSCRENFQETINYYWIRESDIEIGPEEFSRRVLSLISLSHIEEVLLESMPDLVGQASSKTNVFSFLQYDSTFLPLHVGLTSGYYGTSLPSIFLSKKQHLGFEPHSTFLEDDNPGGELFIIPPMRYLKSFSKTFYNFERDPVMKELQLQHLRYVVQYMQMVSTFFLTQLEALMEIYSPDNMMLICETKYLNQSIVPSVITSIDTMGPLNYRKFVHIDANTIRLADGFQDADWNIELFISWQPWSCCSACCCDEPKFCGAVHTLTDEECKLQESTRQREGLLSIKKTTKGSVGNEVEKLKQYIFPICHVHRHCGKSAQRLDLMLDSHPYNKEGIAVFSGIIRSFDNDNSRPVRKLVDTFIGNASKSGISAGNESVFFQIENCGMQNPQRANCSVLMECMEGHANVLWELKLENKTKPTAYNKAFKCNEQRAPMVILNLKKNYSI
ncbi:hypothetical protein WR25_19794 isoform B [Diploscapter pachys]|uniref:Uncharacterized protein n=1 Tax=Diploscapter pachys TaxID=2018661 RepID=A0A2A2JDV0_9BILA|nr:hypothetical protein WR25_19794 isoform A [Diploscapter pachys]PAV59884.1 hypothetical protein WR25_19794 isoform B [Diploscapter pachys]